MSHTNEYCGTIKTFWCCNCCELQQDEEGNNIKEQKRRHVLGADDQWYCEVCDAHYFNNIVEKQEVDTGAACPDCTAT